MDFFMVRCWSSPRVDFERRRFIFQSAGAPQSPDWSPWISSGFVDGPLPALILNAADLFSNRLVRLVLHDRRTGCPGFLPGSSLVLSPR
jgi:hypothetical protein